MPKSTIREISPEAQAQRLAALRRARYGDLLALHILLWTNWISPCCPKSGAPGA